MINNPAIVQILWPVTSSPKLRAFVLAVGGALLITISAKIQIPFYPVPQTLQTMVVLLIGMAYGTKLGVATVATYLAAGALGLPVFAGTPEKGIGITYMVGATGGYLLGFLLAAAVCGWFAKRGFDCVMWKAAVAMTLGNVVIYFFGVLWLGTVIGWDKPVLEYGVYPFLPAAVAKITIATIMLAPVAKIVRKK